MLIGIEVVAHYCVWGCVEDVAGFWGRRELVNWQLVALIAELVLLGVLLAIGAQISRARLGELFPLPWPRPGQVLGAGLAGLATQIFEMGLGRIACSIFPILGEILAWQYKKDRDLMCAATAIHAIVIAPILEEALFRGMILRGFRLRYRTASAILFSALLFGLYHVGLVQALAAIIPGVWMAWLVVATGSLIPAIAGHAVCNAVWVLFCYRTLDWLPDFSAATYLLVGASLLAAGLYWAERSSACHKADARWRYSPG